ncbi:MAG: response regulator [Xenococcaceae cyanobacterium MO_188.B29]|nr:response regulator [Xenococcaceae cyanobacterium MO_188.B29]
MIRILIADDANLIRQALNIYFKLEPNLEIVGTAENGKTALKLVEELTPDIVLMDMEMPEMDGLTATQIISERFPKTKVLMISSHNTQYYIDKALEVGANGYFIKSTPAEELSEAIQLIYEKDVRIIPTFSEEEPYLILPDSSDSTKNTESIPEPVLQKTEIATKERENEQTIEPEKSISKNIDSNNSGNNLSSFTTKTSPINRDKSPQIKVTDVPKSRLSSLSLDTLYKFLPPLKHFDNSPKTWGIVSLSVFGVVIFLASVFRYRMTVTAQAQISPSGEIVVVQAPLEGTIDKIKVTENQTVEAGETIAVIRNSQLHGRKKQLEESIERVQQHITKLDSQINRLDWQITNTIAESKSPTSEQKIVFQETKEILQQKLEGDRQRIQKIENNLRESNIRAPITGTVQKLYLHHQEQPIHTGELIAKISSNQAPLLVKASVASQDIDRVAKNQKVSLRVFACPHTYYGTLQGKTIDISPPSSQTPKEENTSISEQKQNINSASDTYEVIIEPASLALRKDKQKCLLQSGMKARADIITREETILALILRKARLIN